MSRTCRQKSPFTSSTRPATFAAGSLARYASSCSTYGYRQAEVLPEPMAPTTSVPVYRPRSGIVSHVGEAARAGEGRRCCSPCTTNRSERWSGRGYGGSGPMAVVRPWRPTKMYRHDRLMLATRNDDVVGTKRPTGRHRRPLREMICGAHEEG